MTPPKPLPTEMPMGANPEASRPKTMDALLGDQVVVIKRLGTRDGLAVAQKLLTYIGALRDPIVAAVRGKDLGALGGEVRRRRPWRASLRQLLLRLLGSARFSPGR